MKLRYTIRAVSDLETIADYLMRQSPQGAASVGRAIRKALANIREFPGLGRRQSLDDVRKVATRRFPYVIYYRVDWTANEVIVLTIQHTSREREFTER